MVTRRAMLKGTAAGSIAAIASAHGVAASAAPPAGPVPIPYPNGMGAGYGNLEGGAVGGFLKVTDGFNVFFKFHETGAEVFMKEDAVGAIDTHIKFFDKVWSVQHLDPFYGSLDDASAGFYKLDAGVAGIFLKYKVDGEDSFRFRYLSVSADGDYSTEPPDYSGYCNEY